MWFFLLPRRTISVDSIDSWVLDALAGMLGVERLLSTWSNRQRCYVCAGMRWHALACAGIQCRWKLSCRNCIRLAIGSVWHSVPGTSQSHKNKSVTAWSSTISHAQTRTNINHVQIHWQKKWKPLQQRKNNCRARREPIDRPKKEQSTHCTHAYAEQCVSVALIIIMPISLKQRASALNRKQY